MIEDTAQAILAASAFVRPSESPVTIPAFVASASRLCHRAFRDASLLYIRNAVIPLQSDDDGKQLENTVYLELLRRRGGNETISFWQDRGECDFVVSEDENVRQLVQVTWRMNEDSPEGRKTRKREIDGLVAAAESLKCENLTIVTHDEDSVVRDRGHDIRVVPAWKWCLAK